MNNSSAGGITRRDLIHGVAAAGVGSLLPSKALADAVEAATHATGSATAYPPELTGLRGNHDGSWETAHLLGRSGQREFGPVGTPDDPDYDLVVVGAGISGLAAAYFYRKAHPEARVLLLDNHDDFGGHAKRNEFAAGGSTLLGYGGSQTMQDPKRYPEIVKTLIKDIGVDLDVFPKAYDSEFFRTHDLAAGVFFDEKNWGSSRMVKYDLNGYKSFLPMAEPGVTVADAVQSMPMSARARQQVERVITETADCIPHIPADEKEDYLFTITYREFLERHMGVTEPEVFKLLNDLTFEQGLGIEHSTAATSLLFYALPGRAATGVDLDWGDFEYIHHFPDGNASVARLLVKQLMPHVSESADMYELLEERLDYARLDLRDADVRLRLSSTVVNVQHRGDSATAKDVDVTYVRNGRAERVRAGHVVLACYHSIIPSLCPELPAAQREAMALQVKTPILYTNVALNNWHALKDMGIGAFVAPTGYHIAAMLDFPVSLGDYRFAAGPDDPIVMHMQRFPYGREEGLRKRDRLRAGRYELLMTPFADIERSIRSQLTEAFGPAGFKADRDIAGITVNRWAHGYAYDYDPLEDDSYDSWDDPRYPHMQARKRHGRIAIANADAAANAMLESAVEEAYRAVSELS